MKQLADQSSVIVRGRLANANTRAVNGALYTFYDLTVVETAKGRPPKSMSVAVLGGSLGNVQLEAAEVPPLKNGDEIVFFGKPFPGQFGAFKATGEFAGLVPILSASDKRAVVIDRGKPEPVETFLDRVRELSKQPTEPNR